MRLPSAFWALAGSLITGLFFFGGQMIVQKHEDRRNLQEIAYKYALEEWKVIVSTSMERNIPLNRMPAFREKLMEHLVYASMIADYGPDKMSEKKGEDLWKIFLDEYFSEARKKSPGIKNEQSNANAANHTQDSIKP